MTTKTRRFGIRTLTLILAFLMIVYIVPLTVIAENLRMASNATTEEVTDATTAIKDVFELTDLREETVKHFRTEDGSVIAVVYPNAVHRQDEGGVWQDIDNHLAEKGSEIATSDARVKFAKKITGNETLFTLHDGNYKLTMSLDGAIKKTTATITNTVEDENLSALGKQMTLENLSARILYSNILENVDLEYVVVSNDIKENIIVKAPGGAYTYAFTLQLNNLTAQQSADGSIGLYDRATGKRMYVFPCGYMKDAADACSTAVSYSLTDNGNGKYTFTATADSAWMNAPERVFPVTIDPPIYTGTGSNVTDLYVDSSSVNANNSSSYNLFVSPTQRTYWKLDTLPTLPASAHITNAELFMYAFAAAGSSSYIGVYQVTSDWTQSLTWAGVVASAPAGSIAETYIDARPMSNKGTFSWNVLPIVQSWYDGTNYGLALECLTSGTSTFYSDDFNTLSRSPQLCITYRDAKGIEDYWTYSSQDLGFAGTGHVNLATGNLTFAVPTLSTLDALMPFTLSLVYNSQLGSQYYTSSVAKTVYTAEGTPSGFKFNTQESLIEQPYVKSDGTAATCFIWADGDGTEHYFLPTDTANEFIDEDGLLLTLIKGSTTCTITDSSHGVRTFVPATNASGGWVLSTVQDAVGNTLTIENDNATMLPKIIKMTPNGVSESYTIEHLEIRYNTAGRPYLILNLHSHEAVVLQYSRFGTSTISTAANAGYLLHVIHARGTSSTDWLAFYNAGTTASTSSVTVDAVATYSYTYTTSTVLTGVKNTLSNYTVNYAYTNGKVTAITEQGGTITGQSARITYNATSTCVRTSGQDDVINNTDDLYTYYQFDAAGRAIGSYATDHSQSQLFGGTGISYTDGDNFKANNKIKTVTQSDTVTANYIRNGGFEIGSTTLTYWSQTGTIVIAGSVADDDRYVRMQGESSISQVVDLNPGTYTLSVPIESFSSPDLTIQVTATSSTNSAHHVTQSVPVNQNYASGDPVYVQLQLKAASTSASYTERYTITVTVSGNSEQYVHIDDIMLSKTIGMAPFSRLEAGDFETTNGISPNSFWTTASGGSITRAYTDPAHEQSLVISGALGQTNYVSQTVFDVSSVTRDFNPAFTVTGWVKGTAQSYGEGSLFGARFTIIYENSAGVVTSVDYDIAADKSLTEWQYLCGTVESESSKGSVKTVILRLVYNDHPGIGYFDDFAVMIGCANTTMMTYNTEGRVTVQSKGIYTAWYSYNENNDLVYAVSSDFGVQKYAYNSNYQVTSIDIGTVPRFIADMDTRVENATIRTRIKYNYNIYGLCTSQSTVEINQSGTTLTEGISSITQYTYYTALETPIFGTLQSETDARAGKTTYFYNTNNGRLNAVTYPDNTGTCYTYDGMGNITGVYPATYVSSTNYSQNTSISTKATYTYNANNRLSAIVANGTRYNFYYDSFGNSSSVSVNGYGSLATYTYNSYNGKLNTVTFGNGFSEKYVYDELDRISEIRYNTGNNGAYVAAYRYTYTAGGQLSSVENVASREKTYYRYDASGRLINTIFSNTNTHLNESGVTLFYDEENRVNSIMHSFDYPSGSDYFRDIIGNFYAYDDTTGIIECTSLYGNELSGFITPTYDKLNRVTARTAALKTGTGAFYMNSAYAYMAGTHGQTGLVSQLQNKVGTSASNATVTNTWNYTYDENGNITQITDAGGVVQYKYTYDALGQLTREDNRPLGKTYVYTYDAAGNITSTKRYAFSTGTLGTLQATDSYTYGNDDWKDLLTGYNGKTIVYDGIGNPTRVGVRDADGEWSSWQGYHWQGRQLESVSVNGSTSSGEEYDVELYYYQYNDEGIRIEKMVTGYATIQYLLNGTQIVGENINDEILLIYVYDEAGSVIGLKYRTSSYAEGVYDCFFFEKNLQGDIVAIYNESGNKIGGYNYDAWGDIVTLYTTAGATTLEAEIVETYNPFRYRGYYYDIETGFYYLQSRYYNPEWGRFLNADALVDQSSVLGYNLFAYCRNNPVNMTDTTGNLPFFAITAAIGAVVGAVVGGVVAAKNGGNVWAGIGIGAAAGALIGTGAGMAAGAALAGSITATTGAVMAGGSTLVATVGTGGLGAGATYIANNLSQAANNLAPAAQTAASKMQEVVTKGKAGEALSGLAKNTSHIPSLTGTASYRIPDGLDAGMRILSEVKNYSGTLSYTNQLKDFVMWSQANGYQMHLYTNATVTGPLQQVVDSGIIQLFPLG